jgi:mannose-6-phosphate isomerase-like protein (cupin superfamily)
MKLSLNELLKKIPGPVTAKWPMGERFIAGLNHGSMSVELYAPQGNDPQTPHEQDELYFVQTASAELRIGAERFSCVPGDVLFVAAGVEHRFETFSGDFVTWAAFWRQSGGEKR